MRRGYFDFLIGYFRVLRLGRVLRERVALSISLRRLLEISRN
jgi:hypothetical protein